MFGSSIRDVILRACLTATNRTGDGAMRGEPRIADGWAHALTPEPGTMDSNTF